MNGRYTYPQRVLLIVAASSRFWRELGATDISTPPTGVLSLAAVLRMHGHQVAVMDLFMGGYSAAGFRETIRGFMPDVVGISCYTESYRTAVLLSKMVREELRAAPIVLGGPHVTFTVDQTFRESPADYIVMGEGEATIVELLLHLAFPDVIPISSVAGLAWRDGDRVVVNRPRPFIESLDALPLVDFSLVDVHAYRMPWVIVTSRGCPGGCIFCSSRAMWGPKYRCRSAPHVFSEVVFRAGSMEPRVFTIVDDTFTAGVHRLRQFCELLIAAKLDVEWRCESRADVMTPELLDLMRKAGCTCVQFGIETGDPQVLRSLNKKISLDHAEALVAHAARIGLRPRCSFIVGHHTDTKESLQKTLALAKRFRQEYGATVAVSANTPYPGTWLYNHLDEAGITLHSTDWDDFLFSDPVISTRNLDTNDIRTALFDALEFLAQQEMTAGTSRA
ncbi:MAG: B12-binding domain-containing radical SAM protein [Acetobacteraceae bacterium]|nr:B12-binding domain-containing radical SAM protein [Acetobacteraceae bacterium]